MIVDQDEIESLRKQSDTATAETPQAVPAATERTSAQSPIESDSKAPGEIAGLLKLRVPVIAQLASRRMTIAYVRKLSLGTILEFSKGVDEHLDLLINNHPIGRGEAVKVDERFGLKISAIRDAETRIRSMGQ
jgi:flagellar motor switch protein FliN/FliY